MKSNVNINLTPIYQNNLAGVWFGNQQISITTFLVTEEIRLPTFQFLRELKCKFSIKPALNTFKNNQRELGNNCEGRKMKTF